MAQKSWIVHSEKYLLRSKSRRKTQTSIKQYYRKLIGNKSGNDCSMSRIIRPVNAGTLPGHPRH